MSTPTTTDETVGVVSSSDFYVILCVSYTLKWKRGEYRIQLGGERAHIHVSLCRESKIGSFLDGGAHHDRLSTDRSVSLRLCRLPSY